MKKSIMEVTGLTIYPPQGYMVILKERDGNRWLPIFIGPAEARNISILLQAQKFPRPLTFDLFHSLLEAAGAKIEDITVTELKDSTFYAEVKMTISGGDTRIIDARPSDAIALALKTNSPIYVADAVLEEAGLVGEIATPQSDLGERLRELQQQLQEAIDQEAYEEAARLRDQIRAIEEQMRSS
ncbi:MAG: bifunctional nuclease domain-containing protein [bacterium]